MAEGQNPGNKMEMMTAELSPDVLQNHILPRLPVKSVCRFMCVSRGWHSFLTTPHFANMQLLHLNQNQNHHQNQKLLLISTGETPYNFRTIDCETPDKDCLTANRCLPFTVSSGEFCTVLGSLNGLVCIQKHWFDEKFDEYTDLILWNPLTSDYKRLSKPSCDAYDWYWMRCRGQFGLYYSTSDEDYKLVCVTEDLHPKVYIYSLKSDSWKKLDDETTNYRTASKCYSNFVTKSSVLLNDKLYFLKQNGIRGENPSYFIMMFDTKTEKLRKIATPTLRKTTELYGYIQPGKEKTDCIGFMVLRGSIHLCMAFTDFQGDHQTIELWRMNRDGDWTIVVTYPPIECLSFHEKPLHIMRNGDWLMFCRGDVYQRDMNKPTSESDIICRFESMQLSRGWPWKYMETLVSPNQYACL